MRPIRFGVSVRPSASRAEWQAKARRVEELGYSALLTSDHLVESFPPLVPLVSAAEATTTLRVGTLVLNNDLRHPVLLAREAAAVDLLTDGRLELGLGAGHMRSEYEEAGIPWSDGPTRVERLGEALRIVKGLFTGEEVTLAGRHYDVRGHRGFPLPAQRPRPPLLVGGHNAALLAMAAREADIVGLVGFRHRGDGAGVDLASFTWEGAARQVAHIREAAGDRVDDLELNALVQQVTVTDDPARALARWEDHGLSVDELVASPYVLVGTEDELVDRLLARGAQLGITYHVVFEPAMELLAPVVARLSGG